MSHLSASTRSSLLGDTGVEIIPGLLLGDRRLASNLEALQALGVTHIVNATVDVRNYFEKQAERGQQTIEYLRCPCHDTDVADLSQHFSAAHAFISCALHEGNTVLIHCQQGISRSVALAIAFLMKSRSMSLSDAYTHVKMLRPQARPNTNFIRQLVKYAKELEADREKENANKTETKDQKRNETSMIASSAAAAVAVVAQQMAASSGPAAVEAAATSTSEPAAAPSSTAAVVAIVSDAAADSDSVSSSLPPLPAQTAPHTVAVPPSSTPTAAQSATSSPSKPAPSIASSLSSSSATAASSARTDRSSDSSSSTRRPTPTPSRSVTTPGFSLLSAYDDDDDDDGDAQEQSAEHKTAAPSPSSSSASSPLSASIPSTKRKAQGESGGEGAKTSATPATNGQPQSDAVNGASLPHSSSKRQRT